MTKSILSSQSSNWRCPGGPIVDDKNIKKSIKLKINQIKFRKIKNFSERILFIMITKVNFVTVLANLYFYQLYFEFLPKSPENRGKIADCRNQYKELLTEIPDAKYFRQPKDYYNYLISAGIGKKTAAWFLNKKIQDQLSTVVKIWAESGDEAPLNNWREAFGKTFRAKMGKIYGNSALNHEFCHRHRIMD